MSNEQPKLSDDGKFFWNGSVWEPLPGNQSRDVATGVAGGTVNFLVGILAIPVLVVVGVLIWTSIREGQPFAGLAVAALVAAVGFWWWKRLR